MTEAELAAQLADEVSRISREEAATATRAERAADPSIGPPPPTQSAPSAEGASSQAEAAVSMLAALPPELVTPMLIALLDLVARRVANYFGGEPAASRFALKPDEHALLSKVWQPIVAHYMAQLNVSPLVAAVGVTGVVYGLKALPEGGLNAVLGGASGGPVPRAAPPAPPQPQPVPVQKFEPPPRPPPPASPEQLINKPEPDPVLNLATKKAAELKAKREAKEAAPA